MNRIAACLIGLLPILAVAEESILEPSQIQEIWIEDGSTSVWFRGELKGSGMTPGYRTLYFSSQSAENVNRAMSLLLQANALGKRVKLTHAGETWCKVGGENCNVTRISMLD